MAKHPEAARAALRAYEVALNPTGSEYADDAWPTGHNYQTNLVDLLVDLQHFVDGFGGPVDFESALDTASIHYTAEAYLGED